MLILVELAVAIAAGVSMYVIVERYNTRLWHEHDGDTVVLRSINSGGAGVLTAFLALVAAPYYFYRMHGPVGVLYGLLFLVAMGVSYALLSGALVLTLQALS